MTVVAILVVVVVTSDFEFFVYSGVEREAGQCRKKQYLI